MNPLVRESLLAGYRTDWRAELLTVWPTLHGRGSDCQTDSETGWLTGWLTKMFCLWSLNQNIVSVFQQARASPWLFPHAVVCTTIAPGSRTPSNIKRRTRLPVKSASLSRWFKPTAHQSWPSSSVLCTRRAVVLIKPFPARNFAFVWEEAAFPECESWELNGQCPAPSYVLKQNPVSVLVDRLPLRSPSPSSPPNPLSL